MCMQNTEIIEITQEFKYFLALLLLPLMQEYFDPIIIILTLMIFKTKIKLGYYNVFFLFIYFATFLSIANIYYLNLLH